MRTLLFAAALLVAAATAAAATPSRLIILRHGEKADAYQLCRTGVDRAAALAATYLGKGAAKSLFSDGEGPAAFVAITPHTLELAAPAATTWGLPVATFTALPFQARGKAMDALLNLRTQQAVQDVLANPAYAGRPVVMVWEHHHIADAGLEKAYPGEKVTLRQLLGLEALPGVPETWPGSNYDMFWIVDFAAGSAAPTGFRMEQQSFAAPYAAVPSNAWGAPQKLPSGCRG